MTDIEGIADTWGEWVSPLAAAQDYAATEQHEAPSFRRKVEMLGDDPDAWEARVGRWSLVMTASEARAMALGSIAAMHRASSETLDTLGEQLRMSDAAVTMRRATAHAAVIRAVTGYRAGERPRLRASVRAVLR